MLRTRLACLTCGVATVLAAIAAVARAPQDVDRVRVVAIEAAIRLRPDPTSLIVTTVVRGAVLDVQARDGEWIGVFVPGDDGGPRRHGYIQSSMVERTAGPSGSTSDTAFVLDEGRRTVGVIDPVAGKTRFVSFGSSGGERGAPTELLRSPDGTRLIVIDIGHGSFDLRTGFRPRRRSTLTVLDSSSLNVVGTTDGVWGLPIYRFSRDGRRLTVAGAGDDGHPSEAVTLDVTTGTIVARLDLGSYARGQKHWLQWYLGTALSSDGQYLYVLDWGRRSRNARDSIPGRIHVIAAESLQPVGVLDAGPRPRSLQVDCARDQLYALSDPPPDASAREERVGELRVIRGAGLAATIGVDPLPLFVRASSDGSRLHVLSEGGVVSVDALTLRGPTRTEVERAPVRAGGDVLFWYGVAGWTVWRMFQNVTSSWEPEAPFDGIGDRALSDFVVTPDGRRGFAIHAGASRLSILDLDERRRIGTVSTRHETVKTTASMVAYGMPALRAMTDLAIRPDGRFVYVLDSITGDLTIIESDTGKLMGRLRLGRSPAPVQSAGGPLMGWSSGASAARRLAIRPTGGPRPLIIFPEANLLGVRTPHSLAFVDMRTNSEVPALRMAGLPHAAALAPDGRRLYVLSTGRVSYLDAKTGKFLASLTEFEDPAHIVFAGRDPVGSTAGCSPQ